MEYRIPFEHLNRAYEGYFPKVYESWRSVRKRLQEEHPAAKIKYSYKTKVMTILYPLPTDFIRIRKIVLNQK